MPRRNLVMGLFVLPILSSGLVDAQEPKLILPVGHTMSISSSSFSPDGKRIVTASDDNSAKLWDATSGALLANLQGHTRMIKSASFSPDGKRIVTVADYETVKIWDANTGILLTTLPFGKYLVSSAEFSPDGKKIITAGIEINKRPVKIWDANTGSLLADPELQDYSLLAAQFSPDEKKILTVGKDSTSRILDAVTGTILVNLIVANSAQFSRDGKKVATVSENSIVKIWDANTGTVHFQTKGNGDQYNIVKVQFSPDGNRIVIASKDPTLKVWDLNSGKLVTNLKGHSYSMTSVFFSPDGQKIVTASLDGTAKVWDAGSGALLADLANHSGSVYCAKFSSDGKKIITASLDKTAKLWDATTGKMLADLKGHTFRIDDARFTPDGKQIFVTSQNSVKQWSMLAGIPELDFNEYNADIVSGELSADGKKLMIAYSNSFYVLDIVTGKKLVAVRDDNFTIYSARFSPDGKKILTTFDSTIATIWNAETGKKITNLKVTKEIFNEGNFSPDGKQVAIYSYLGDEFARIYDATTGKLLNKITGELATFSPDGGKILTTGFQSIDIWEAVTGKRIGYFPLACGPCSGKIIQFSLKGNRIGVAADIDSTVFIYDFNTRNSVAVLTGHRAAINSIYFSHDEKNVVTSSADGSARVYDVQSGKLLFVLAGNLSSIESARFSPDDEKILTVSGDNVLSIWNAHSGKLIFTNIAVDSADYFVQSSEAYYFSTPSAAKLLHYVTKDLNVITFEQLDVKYNRPDKVLEGIGNTDTAMIKSYRKAWEKRIRKLGIDTTAFQEGYSVPEADFANRGAIEYEQKNGNLSLHLKATDSTYKLDRFNVWVNEIPVYGQRGISIRKRNKNDLDTTIIITLSQGENRIETSIANVNGIESYRMPLYVNYTPAVKQKERTRFIGIGIDKFSDSKYNLQYSSKDIRDLSKRLKERYKDSIIIDTLFNENVTTINVKALKEKLLQTTENDKVILAYSGHGMLSKDYDYYLSTYSVNFSKPEENGLPYEELENLLDSIPARKKLMLIDACHSGEVDKEELLAIRKKADSLGLTMNKPVVPETTGKSEENKTGATKGGDTESTGEKQLGLNNSFELMQSLFVNVGKSTGATIISAAGGQQFALEGVDNLSNGVFTYSILQAMKEHPTLKISELKKIVGERVEALTKGLQKPTSRNETIAVNWDVW